MKPACNRQAIWAQHPRSTALKVHRAHTVESQSASMRVILTCLWGLTWCILWVSTPPPPMRGRSLYLAHVRIYLYMYAFTHVRERYHMWSLKTGHMQTSACLSASKLVLDRETHHARKAPAAQFFINCFQLTLLAFLGGFPGGRNSLLPKCNCTPD